MNEALLQYIWQYSLYQPSGLTTTSGEEAIIIYPGRKNTDSGPDFLEAKIKIGTTILVGNIEIHTNSSDWVEHGHQHDAAYKNILLHLVYNNDLPGAAGNVPVVELKDSIPNNIIAQYAALINAPLQVPCSRLLPAVSDITKYSWLSRMLAERWEQKMHDWRDVLHDNTGDWSTLLYWRIAANFGFKVNTPPFLMLAQSIPINILAKHRENLFQLEALLFGQAGMLGEGFAEDYPKSLKGEYLFLQQKYGLTPIPPHLWKFMRMRPANFPTVRIAQFAALVHKSLHLFSQIVSTNNVKDIIPLLQVTASDYWNTHYRFDEVQKRMIAKHLGLSSIYNIIINTVAPVIYLYAQEHGNEQEQEKALLLLDNIPYEQNNITDLWEGLGWEAKDAGQSQALIQLHNNYCSQKRCLECAIGLQVMKSGPYEG
jgi:Protein of unknown function (DUF2851)